MVVSRIGASAIRDIRISLPGLERTRSFLTGLLHDARAPAAMQSRYPRTPTEIGAGQNSTVVFPMPIDITKLFRKKAAKGVGAGN